MQTNFRPERRTVADVLPSIESPKRKSAGAEAANVAGVLAANEAPQAMKQLDAKALQKLLQTADFIEPEENPLDANAQTQALETREAVAKVEASLRRQLSGVVDNASRTAVAALVANGINLDKISLSVLNELMAEIEANPDVETADESVLRERIAALTEDYSLLPEVAEKFAAYAMKLAGAGAAVTVKNLLALENVDSLHDKLTDMNDAEIVSILREDAPLTLERAYSARFRVPNPKAMPDADWQKLAPSVRQSFARENVPETEENLGTARLLLANEAAASKENVENAQFLRRITYMLDREIVLSRGAEQLAKREPAAAFLLNETNLNDTKQLQVENTAVAEGLSGLTAAHIDLALLQSTAPTLGALLALPDAPDAVPNTTDAALRFKRQLAELQVVMTREAASRLARKGFHLETVLPEEALTAVRELEQADAARALRQAGAADSPQNVNAMTALSGQLRHFRLLPASAYPALLANRAKLTPASVSNMAALESYDLAATPVSAKYGDSFANVADQFAPLLEAMNLPATAENLHAARLLSRSQTDVTPDSVLAVRGLAAQLEHVATRLHPYLAARLLKAGLDPTRMTLAELTEHISVFEMENGKTDADHLAAHIAALDRQNALSPTEREVLLGVYRALHKAQADDNAALGAAMRAGRTLSLANLAETADAFRGAAGRFSAVDVSLADDEATRRASTHVEAEFLARRTVSKVIRHAAPAPLHELLGEGGAEWPLSETAESLAASTAAGTDAEVAVRTMLMAAGHVPAAAAVFLQVCGVPLTLANLNAFRKLEREPDAFEGMLNESKAAEALAEMLPDEALEALRNGENPAELLARLAEQAEKAQAADASRPLDEVVRALRLQSAVAAATRSFHIPVNRNGKTADVHIYMLNEQADVDDTEMYLALGTRFGVVKIRASVADETISIAAQTTPAGASALTGHRGSLAEAVATAGLTLGGVAVESTVEAAPAEGAVRQVNRRLRPNVENGAVPTKIFILAAALLEWIQQAETDFGSTETDFNDEVEGVSHNEN